MRKTYKRTEIIKKKMRVAALRAYKKMRSEGRPFPQLGMHLSDESKDKIRQAQIGYNQRLRKAGKSHPLKGRKLPAEQRHRQSLTMKGRFAAAKHWHWKGGRKMSMGYIYVLAPGHPGANSFGYVREHRLVMEKMIGRLLKPSEVVHHKNRDKTDNRPENLVLFGNHKDHSNFRESQKVCPHCGGRL